jgi:tRNA threonylcarbamoyladenosine biosynthesis protein TsaE
MKKTFTCSQEKELDLIAPAILEFCGRPVVVAVSGPMGAGKTTLIKALCRALGVTTNVSSPTFSLVNEYNDAGGNPVYHFDFYRIESLSEAYDLGYEEYFYSGHFCFVEWPEKILNLLPQDVVSVTLQVENGIRLISVSHE